MALISFEQRARVQSRYGAACRRLRKADPVLASVIHAIGPCRLKPRRDHFATLCDSIIAQQLSPMAAATIYARFASLYAGRRPTPEAVARTRLTRLRGVGLSGQKAAYIKDLAGGFLDGRVAANRFARQTNEEIIASLSSIRGIGRWTAEMFLIFALNRLDVLPVDDLGIRKAVQQCYGLRSLPRPERLRLIARPWNPYETIACWYLWQGLHKDRSAR